MKIEYSTSRTAICNQWSSRCIRVEYDAWSMRYIIYWRD